MQTNKKIQRHTLSSVALATITAMVISGCGGGSKSNNTNPTDHTNSNNSVTCSAGNATGVAAANCMIAEMLSVGGARVGWSGSPGSLFADTAKLVSTSLANTYTLSWNSKEVVTPSVSWVNSTSPGDVWQLTANGWVLLNLSITDTLHNNGDGTLTQTDGSENFTLSSLVKTDISGQGIVCNNNPTTVSGVNSVPCATPSNFPSGSVAYSMTRTDTSDAYELLDGAFNGSPDVLTNAAGVPLTALPAVGTTTCINGKVYVPIVPTPAAGLDNYNVHLSPSGMCTPAGAITQAIAAPASSTALVASKTVHGVAILTAKQGVQINIAAFNAQAGNRFMSGVQYRTVGTVRTRDYVNKIAANAQLAAHGLPVLP